MSRLTSRSSLCAIFLYFYCFAPLLLSILLVLLYIYSSVVLQGLSTSSSSREYSRIFEGAQTALIATSSHDDDETTTTWAPEPESLHATPEDLETAETGSGLSTDDEFQDLDETIQSQETDSSRARQQLREGLRNEEQLLCQLEDEAARMVTTAERIGDEKRSRDRGRSDVWLSWSEYTEAIAVTT